MKSSLHDDLELSGHNGTVRCVCFQSPRSSTLVSGGAGDNALRVWDIESRSNQPLLVLTGHNDAIFSVRSVPGEINQIISAGADSVIRLWDLRSGCMVSKIVTNSSVEALAISDTQGYGGVRVAAGHADHSVSVWDLASTRKIFQVRNTRNIY